MIKAIEFQAEKPDDLLVWADLWEDEGLPRHGQILRELHETGRWPMQFADRTVAWIYKTRPDKEDMKRKASIDWKKYGCILSNGRRYYPSTTLAFLELVLYRVEKEAGGFAPRGGRGGDA